jgi:hypothetical protein
MAMFFWVWRRVDSSVDANVSEKDTVFIFSPEHGDSMFPRNEVNILKYTSYCYEKPIQSIHRPVLFNIFRKTLSY